MQEFVWGDQFLIGVEMVDRQHRRLVDLYNQLQEKLNSDGFSGETLKDAIEGLLDYVQIHFDTEEQLMKESGYDQMQKHFAEHQQLTRHVYGLYQKQAGAIDYLGLMSFLQDWLQNHILGTDKKFGSFYVESQQA